LKYIYNCQQSTNNKDIYIIPNPDIPNQQTSKLLCYHGKTIDYIPIFYNNLIEIEELIGTIKTLTKQPLTNYEQLLAYYPQIAHKYK